MLGFMLRPNFRIIVVHAVVPQSDEELEDYGFEYSDEEQEEQDVDIENQYYNSKGKLVWHCLGMRCSWVGPPAGLFTLLLLIALSQGVVLTCY